MLQQKEVDVYKALAQLNRWMYQKYKDNGTVKIPYCSSKENLDKWTWQVFKKMTWHDSIAQNNYGKPVKAKFENLNYSEAILLLNLVIGDKEISDHCFEIDWDSKTHRKYKVEVNDDMYGAIVVSRSFEDIIITVKKGLEGDVDLEFWSPFYKSI